MKKCKSKYETGGDLATAIAPQLIGMVSNAALPGASAVVTPILNAVLQSIVGKKNELKTISDHLTSLSSSTNPYGNYKLGGEIKNGYEDLLVYGGDSHSAISGGVTVNEKGVPSELGTSQVEGKETALRIGTKTFIFSNSLKI